MLSVGFFGGSVRPSSPGMPRPHRSPPGSLPGEQPRTPNAHPGTPNVPHGATRCSRGPLHSNFAPQTPQRLQAAGLAAQMLRQEPLGAQTQPPETPNTPPRPQIPPPGPHKPPPDPKRPPYVHYSYLIEGLCPIDWLWCVVDVGRWKGGGWWGAPGIGAPM